ncbi:carbonic anhydrase 1-like [Sorex fumeus]|uniref:carbonic anhydrase 1-like n=1 Tax=Sorex fumeus TaxID=62283 RepID=UPI0024AC9D5B|nr:carbonic anhydrase 1-like [Sorex fumeus]
MAKFGWEYENKTGPEQWSRLYPIANGNNQSPIDIKTRDTKHDPCLRPVCLCYDPATAKEMINDGYTVQITFKDNDNLSVLKNGPVCDIYRLRELHFHWGSIDDCGSEHRVDGVNYSGELHIVHWNSEKYSSFTEASLQADGLVILSVFMKVGQENPNLRRIIETLHAVKTKGKKVPFTNFNPTVLLPSSLDYWTYFGSLTSPPLYESVTWIIYKMPITISSCQLAQFRCLLSNIACETEIPIENNCRPPQPLKGRKVRSFTLDDPGTTVNSPRQVPNSARY